MSVTKRIPYSSYIKKQCFVGDCSNLGGLYQQDPWVHWQCRAGAQAGPIPISFHMIILNFTADGFLLWQTAAAKCQSTDENAMSWERKFEREKKKEASHSTSLLVCGTQLSVNVTYCKLQGGEGWRALL